MSTFKGDEFFEDLKYLLTVGVKDVKQQDEFDRLEKFLRQKPVSNEDDPNEALGRLLLADNAALNEGDLFPTDYALNLKSKKPVKKAKVKDQAVGSYTRTSRYGKVERVRSYKRKERALITYNQRTKKILEES